MKHSEKMAAMRAEAIRLSNETAKGSTGSIGKHYDFKVRDELMAQGVRTAADVRCRRREAVDCKIRVNGRYIKFEIKTACGAVAYGKDLTKDDITAEAVCAGVDYVVYAAEVGYMNDYNFTEQFMVFTREQFIAMLSETGKKGLQSSLKIGKKGGQIEIQPWATKACSARLGRYYDWTDDHGIQTLGEFLQELRG